VFQVRGYLGNTIYLSGTGIKYFAPFALLIQHIKIVPIVFYVDSFERENLIVIRRR
jgi:hypothetical protein